MESLLGLGPIARRRTIPGTQSSTDTEVRYVSVPGSEPFEAFFKKLVRQVTPLIPKAGAALNEACVICPPDGTRLHAISYRGDIDGWRRQISEGAAALAASLARLEGDRLVMPNGRAYRLDECQVSFEP